MQEKKVWTNAFWSNVPLIDIWHTKGYDHDNWHVTNFSEKFKQILQNRGPHSPTFPYIKSHTKYFYLFLSFVTKHNKEGDKWRGRVDWKTLQQLLCSHSQVCRGTLYVSKQHRCHSYKCSPELRHLPRFLWPIRHSEAMYQISISFLDTAVMKWTSTLCVGRADSSGWTRHAIQITGVLYQQHTVKFLTRTVAHRLIDKRIIVIFNDTASNIWL